jgi:hypothetical protein
LKNFEPSVDAEINRREEDHQIRFMACSKQQAITRLMARHLIASLIYGTIGRGYGKTIKIIYRVLIAPPA